MCRLYNEILDLIINSSLECCIKVIYKKMDTPREFHYALLLRGGVADVPGLKAGESAFVGDLFTLNSVAGMSAAEFRERLDASGITMQVGASLSDLRITGRAPSAQFSQLMQLLLALAHDRKPDPDAFAAYRIEEALRLDREASSPRDVNARMDDLLRPDCNFILNENKIKPLVDCTEKELRFGHNIEKMFRGNAFKV